MAGVGIATVLGGGSAMALAANAPAQAPAAAQGFRAEPAPPSPAAERKAAAEDTITRERAIEIATKRVPGARVTDVERDWEHGRRVWEIELHKGDQEYDVHVATDTGEIVRFHQEHDDDWDDDDRYDDDDDRDDDDYDD